MPEHRKRSPFTGAELSALEKMRQAMALGVIHEDIPYEATEPALFSTIRLHQVFSRLTEVPSAEESYDPIERITGLTTALDAMILQSGERKSYAQQRYKLQGLRSAEGNVLNFRRSVFANEVSVQVDHVVKLQSTFPGVEIERFTITDDGYFSHLSLQKDSPKEPSHVESIAWFHKACVKFTDETAASLDYFRDLVEPFLKT
jgi:hypothetical protein